MELIGFRCHCCGACCRWEGVVRLQDDEPQKIAEGLGISVEEFTEVYTDLSDDRKCLVLKMQPDGACCFLDAENHCRIQPYKPKQCASFPFDWKPTPEQEKLCLGLQELRLNEK